MRFGDVPKMSIELHPWAAMRRGVAPELSPRLTSVLSHPTRLSTMSTWEHRWVWKFNNMFPSEIYFNSPTWPLRQALNSAVVPSCLRRFTSTSSRASSMSTSMMWPCAAAKLRAVAPLPSEALTRISSRARRHC